MPAGIMSDKLRMLQSTKKCGPKDQWIMDVTTIKGIDDVHIQGI